MSSGKLYFKNLDALRTIAALMVFFRHSPITKFMLTVPGINVVWAAISSGDLGVEFFFVLSGFLITYLILVEEKSNGFFKLGHFYIRRALRIWPLYYAVVFVGLVIFPLAGKAPETSHSYFYWIFLSNFEHIQVVHYHLKTPMVLGITWSVSIEEQFYLFWPLIFLLFKGKGRPIVMIILIGLSYAFRVYAHSDDSWLIGYYHTIPNVFFLASGGLAAYAMFFSDRLRLKIQEMPRNASVALYLITGVLLLLRIFNYRGYEVLDELSDTFLAFCFILIILEQCFAREHLFEFGRIELFSRMGKYTYSLYLLHPIALKINENIFTKLGIAYTEEYVFPQLILAILLTTAITLASYHLLEKRFLNLKNRFL